MAGPVPVLAGKAGEPGVTGAFVPLMRARAVPTGRIPDNPNPARANGLSAQPPPSGPVTQTLSKPAAAQQSGKLPTKENSRRLSSRPIPC